MRGFAAIGLHMPKIDANIGGAFRAAHCYGAGLIAISGRRYKHSITDTTKAFRSIPTLHTTDDIMTLCPHDCIPVAVEFLEQAIPLPHFYHPQCAFYIFGAEDQTLSKSLLDRCKYQVYVPTAYCMNLAATVNVVLYDRMLKRKNYMTEAN